MTKSFFAYPGQPAQVSESIRGALKVLRDELRIEGFHGWEQNEIAGKFLVDPIFLEIQECDFLAADITHLNFNVTYEIGYAFGKGRRLFLVRNDAYVGDDSLIREVGIFDTLGYKTYQDSRQLANMLTNVSDFRAITAGQDPINKKVPVYIVLPKTRTDREIHLISRSKKASLRYRSFEYFVTAHPGKLSERCVVPVRARWSVATLRSSS